MRHAYKHCNQLVQHAINKKFSSFVQPSHNQPTNDTFLNRPLKVVKGVTRVALIFKNYQFVQCYYYLISLYRFMIYINLNYRTTSTKTGYLSCLS